MPAKPTVRYQFKPTETDNTKSFLNSHSLPVGRYKGQATPQSITDLPCASSGPSLAIWSENIHPPQSSPTNIHNMIINDSLHKVQITSTSTSCWMMNQIWSSINEILLRTKMEWRLKACFNVGEPWEHHGNWKTQLLWMAHFMIPLVWNTQNRQIYRVIM